MSGVREGGWREDEEEPVPAFIEAAAPITTSLKVFSPLGLKTLPGLLSWLDTGHTGTHWEIWECANC